MRKYLLLLVLCLFAMVENVLAQVEKDEGVLQKDEEILEKDQKVLKNQLDSLFYEEAVAAIEEKSFILEADRVIFKTGKNTIRYITHVNKIITTFHNRC